jgi:hypothetical protein
MPVKVKTIAREAAQEALATSLRQAITAQLVTELTRAFSEPPLRDELARVVRGAVADAIAGIDWGNGRPRVGFPRRSS